MSEKIQYVKQSIKAYVNDGLDKIQELKYRQKKTIDITEKIYIKKKHIKNNRKS